MTNKTISRLTFLVAFGLLILFGRNLLSRYQLQTPNEYMKGIAGIKSDDIVRVEILNANSNVIMTKQNGVWKIASKSADAALVNELIGSLLPKTSPQLVSSNKDKFTELNLDQTNGVAVKLITQKGEKLFNVGKQIDSSRIVNIQGIDKAYSVVSVPEIVVHTDDWVDKTVVDIDSQQIKQISFAGKVAYALNQTGDKQWQFEGSQDKVNNDGVLTYCYKFNPFKAEALATEEQKKTFNLLSSGFQISITDKNDSKTDLIFKLVKDQYVVRRSTDEEYFLVSKTTGEGFEKNREGFVASQ